MTFLMNVNLTEALAILKLFKNATITHAPKFVNQYLTRALKCQLHHKLEFGNVSSVNLTKTPLKIKDSIKGAKSRLHFDGKRKNGEEYQVIILKNCDKSFKLGIVKCNCGKAMDIFNFIQSVLIEYDAWSSVAMIMVDNSCKRTGK